MEFLTARKGSPHFTSESFREILEAVCGKKSYLADLYEQLEPELVTNNTLKIRSGVLIHHGGVFSVKLGTYDEVTYQNGTQGMKRIDLVVARYTKDSQTGIESGEWVVLQGTPDSTNPVAPTYLEGDMQQGDLVDDCPVFEIHFDGINVTEVKRLVEVTTNIDGAKKGLTELNAKLNDIKLYDYVFERNLPANSVVVPYSYAEFFYLDKEIIKTYGEVVSACANDSSGAPTPCSFYREGELGTYFRVVSKSSRVCIYLTCMKMPN